MPMQQFASYHNGILLHNRCSILAVIVCKTYTISVFCSIVTAWTVGGTTSNVALLLGASETSLNITLTSFEISRAFPPSMESVPPLFFRANTNRRMQPPPWVNLASKLIKRNIVGILVVCYKISSFELMYLWFAAHGLTMYGICGIFTTPRSG